MTYVGKSFAARTGSRDRVLASPLAEREPIIIVIEDGERLSTLFRSVCDCLNVGVEQIGSRQDLGPVLQDHHPMAVIAQMEGEGQDGCHVLMTVASYDRALPTLLLIGRDPILIGAVDAVEEVWGLSSLTRWPDVLGVGEVIDFLFRAGRQTGCLRLMSV